MESTVISDAVNFSSRLESLSKVYGVPAVVSESARKCAVNAGSLSTTFVFRYVDYVRVRGRESPERVFELLHPELVESDRAKSESLTVYEDGVRHLESHQ